MDYSKSKRLLEMHDEQQKALSKTVSISHTEVERLIVERLIEIRNSKVNARNDMSHFDKVIRFWLNENEFKEMVLEAKND